MSDTDDNLIDWSAFDEVEEKHGDLYGSRELRIVSAVLLLIAVVGVVMGGIGFNDALKEINNASPAVAATGAGLGALVQPSFLIFYALLTIIPAAFGFQTAKAPVVFVAPTVLGLLGIGASVVCAIVLLVGQALAASFDPVIPSYFVVCALAAAGYLFFVVRVHKAANASGEVRRRPTKEELWDEEAIWK